MDGAEIGREMLADIHVAIGATHPVTPGGRNHYWATVGGAVANRWEVLVGLGVARRGVVSNDGRDRSYHVIDPRYWITRRSDEQ
jgi:hypothetical protein